MNIEIKAKCSNHEKIRKILKKKNANFLGIDHQEDTYFNVKYGRLKLREGDIENNLVYYQRENKSGPKESDFMLFPVKKDSSLKLLLKKSLGILVIVKKVREIYYLDNVKIQLDNVKGLGKFMEIEVDDKNGKIKKAKAFEQCNYYMNLFGIKKEDLISVSNSDLLLKKKM